MFLSTRGSRRECILCSARAGSYNYRLVNGYTDIIKESEQKCMKIQGKYQRVLQLIATSKKERR